MRNPGEGAVGRLGTVRFNHGGRISDLLFPQDGKTIVSRGNGAVRIWDSATGRELGHFATPQSISDDRAVLSPDGKAMIVLSQESKHDVVRIWDLAQGKEVREVPLPVKRSHRSVRERNALSPDGRLCAVHMPKAIHVFDISAVKELYEVDNKDNETWALLFADNDRLVTVDKKRVICVREARTGKLLGQFVHDFPPANLAPHYLASAQGSLLAMLEHRFVPVKLPNGEMIQLHDRDVMHIWDLITGTRRQALAAQANRWHINVQLSPNGKLLFASSVTDTAYAVTIWDVDTGQHVRELRGAHGTVVAVHPNGSRFAEASWDGKLDLWDLTSGRRLAFEDSRHAVTQTVGFSGIGGQVLTFGGASISVWDGTTNRYVQSFELPPYPYADPSGCHFFSPDGRYAASLAEEKGQVRILVWDIASRQRLHVFQPPGAPRYVPNHVQAATRVFAPLGVTCAFAPDSSSLATCHEGKETVVRLWDMHTGKEIRYFKTTKANGPKESFYTTNGDSFLPGPLFFTPDGKTLFVAGR